MTTATTVAWAAKILAMRPDVQAQLHEEVLRVQQTVEAEPDQEKDLITLGQLSRFEYLDMVVKETLRHFTVPLVTRKLVQDLALEGNPKKDFPEDLFFNAENTNSGLRTGSLGEINLLER